MNSRGEPAVRAAIGQSRSATVTVLVIIAAALWTPAAASGGQASLPAIERQVMCVTCGIPLNTAQSAQADRERAFIQSLIDRGQNEAQIKRSLVGQYGPAVLATPSSSGFGLVGYAVPLVVGLGVVALLAVLILRWRGRTGPAPSPGPTAALAEGDRVRLDADLARFEG